MGSLDFLLLILGISLSISISLRSDGVRVIHGTVIYVEKLIGGGKAKYRHIERIIEYYDDLCGKGEYSTKRIVGKELGNSVDLLVAPNCEVIGHVGHSSWGGQWTAWTGVNGWRDAALVIGVMVFGRGLYEKYKDRRVRQRSM